VAATFEQEAEVTKQNLAQYLPFDAVFASPLTRARRLAAYCGYPQPRLDNRLKEMYMGEWEMQSYEEITNPYKEEWYNDYMHLPTPGGEGFPQVYQRVAAFLDELRQKDYQRVAVFAHGGVLICAGIYGGLFSEADAWDHLVPYGGMEKIEI
jgi:alpha-ribazole phosphatase